MKTMHSDRRFWSLLLTFGLCFVHFGLADISLKLQNNGYLPPPSQHLDNNRYSSQQQREFQESNYGSSPYQIFEVHQHFETTPQALQATQTPYAANGYLPPHQELHVQQINNQLNSGHNSAEENEDNLNISFLSFAAGETSNGQQITLTEKVPEVGATPAGSTVPIPFPSNYKHNFPQQQQQQQSAYKAAEYLPPTQATTTHHHHRHQQPTSTLRQPQSSTPQQSNYQQTTLPYNAPEYLPPRPQPTASVYTTYGQQQTTVATNAQPLQKPQYQAPTYLPPYRHSQGRQRVRQQHRNQVQQHGGKTQVAKTQYNKPNYQAPDFLPPRESSSPQPQQQPQTTQYRSSQYEQRFTSTTSQTSSYQAPTYLPPHQDTTLSSNSVITTTPQRQQSSITNLPTTTSTTAAVALPAGYDYQTPEERQQPENTLQQSTYQSGVDYRAPQQSSTVYNAPRQQSSSTVYNAPQQQSSSTVYNTPQQQSSTAYNAPQQSSTTVGFLPSGYDYNNPEEKLRTTPAYSQQVAQEQQQQQGQQQQQNDHNEEPAEEIPGTTTTFSYRQPQQPQERQVEYHYTQHSLPPLPSPTPSIVQEIYHEQRVLPAGYDEQPEQRQEQAEDYQQRPLPTPSIETQAETHGYLPPGYDQPLPESRQNFQQYSSTTGQTASAPLPQPTPSIVQELRISKTVSSGGSNSYQAPTYLPPGYDAPNPLTAYEQQQVAQLLHSQPENHPQTQVSTTEKRQPGDLPAGYDFEKPDNAEEAIAELHSLQRMLEAQKKAQEQQQQQQQFNGQQHNAQPQQQNIVVQAQLSAGPREQSADIVYGKPKSTVLKPVPSQQTSYQQQPFRQNFRQQKLTAPQPQQQNSHYQQQAQQQQQSRQYQQPQAQSFQSQTNNGYLPPHPFTAVPTASLEPHMHTLSSFMTTVQPNERYGKAIFNTPRMPFPAYGPPPSTTSSTAQPAAFQQSHSFVYAQHNSIQQQQHYAPAMPYNQHHYNGPIRAPAYTTFTYKPTTTYTLRPEARESLQKFMPKDLQEHMAAVYAVQPTPAATHSAPPPIQQPATTTTLHAAQPATAKIRTVQIFNPSAIKTLKVLETLDDKGIKTIKILGPSNEDPMGSHRTIKVVSQSPHNANESRVQHVKIFNDHKEVPLGVESAQQTHSSVSNSNRAYLPPVVGTSTARIARHAQKAKRTKSFTGGRRRYRQ